jgi:hypothetical protein
MPPGLIRLEELTEGANVRVVPGNRVVRVLDMVDLIDD